MRGPTFRAWRVGVLALLASAVAAGGDRAQAQAPPPSGQPTVVRPGAPGAPTRLLTPDELRVPVQARHTEADVAFMRNMIVHHRQALTMSALVPERAESGDIRNLADRIERSQDAEIALMQRWLELRGVETPEPGAGHGHPAHHAPPAEGTGMMAGMLTDEQLASLAAAEGPAFDRLFLELMIQHHEGALDMVAELFSSPGAALDSDVFDFASHVNSDQRIEISRMRTMLGGGP